MQLANDLKRALGKKHAGPWKASGYATGIWRGKVKLKDLEYLAGEGKCSLVYLTSGGNYEEREHIPVKDAVLKSIEHGGHEKHDFARMMGYRDYSYISSMLSKGTIPVKALMKFAKVLKLEIWELLCDSECDKIVIPELEQDERGRLVELNLMGWLDSKRRDQYEIDRGPGL